MSVARDQLKSIVERIERLAEEKAVIADDIKQVFAEAKANGFDTKALRQIIRDRKMEAGERAEFEAILDTYRAALGRLPLFERVGEGDDTAGPVGSIATASAAFDIEAEMPAATS